MRTVVLVMVLLSAAIGCSGGAAQCGPTSTSSCPEGDVCIMGNVCARGCEADAADPCPLGMACVTRSGACLGTACEAIAVRVCQ